MSTFCLIPARSGSKRIPDKNIKPLGGHPLMAWSILTAKELELPCVVSTDSKEYARIAGDYGAEVIMRPQELCTDEAGDLEVIKHALQVLGVMRYAFDDIGSNLVVYLRPTTPFRSASLVMEAIKLMQVPGYDSLRSVEEMSESAYKCFRIRAGILWPLTKNDLTDRPNQELEKTFHPNGLVDIARKEIVDCGVIWGRGRYGFITPRTVEIDTPEDWDYAEYLAQKERRFKAW